MLEFRNSYQTPVKLALSWYDGTCYVPGQVGPWRIAGWWSMQPGQTVTVIDGDLQQKFALDGTPAITYYFLALATDGRFWAGPYRFPYIEDAFSFCEEPGATPGPFGFRDQSVNGYNNFLVNLVE